MGDSVFWLPTNIDHMWEEMMQQVSSKYYFNILVQTITSRCIRSLFIILRGALPGLVVSGSCGGTGGRACLACPRLQGRDTPPAAETPLMTLRLSSLQLKYQILLWSLVTDLEDSDSPFLLPWASKPLPWWLLNSCNWETKFSLRSVLVTATPPSPGRNLSWSWNMRFFRVSSFSFSLAASLLNLMMFLVSNTNSSNFALQITLVLVSRSVRYFWNSDNQGVGRPDWNMKVS